MTNIHLHKKKGLRILLGTALPALVLLFLAAPPVAAQDSGRVSLSLKAATLPQVFNEIKRQTGLSIAFSSEDTHSIPRRDYSVDDQPVEKAMEQVLDGTGLRFEISNGVIVITHDDRDPAQQQGARRHSQITISGTVLDESGDPLQGATVTVVGTHAGTATNADGTFQLRVTGEENPVVKFTYLGMNPYQTAWKGTPLQVTLHPDTNNIEDVIVTGIVKRTRESYTGAVSVVTAEELRSFGNRNALEALRNVDPSFNIIMNNEMGSDPNTLPEVQIRGASSLQPVEELGMDVRSTINTPLIILDGFESSLERFLDMDSDEIETITLLKDAAGTSLYGSRGANGVVVITTKAPKMGRLRVSYSGQLNFEAPDLTGYDLLGAREKLALELEAGYYSSTQVRRDMELKEKYNSILRDINSGVDTYWLSKPLRVGVGHRNTIKIEGGDRSFRYSTSLQYNNTAGVMKESYRRNFNGTVNLSYTHDKVVFRNYLSIGSNNRSDSPYGTFSDYAKLNPYWKVYDEKGRILKVLDDDTVFWGTNPTNPMHNASINTIKTQNYVNITDNFSIEWRPVTGLIINGALGITYQAGESDNFKPAEHTDFSAYTGEDLKRRGKYVYGSNRSMDLDFSTTVTYVKTFNEDHMLNASAYLNLWQSTSRSYTFTVEGFPHKSLDFLGAALQYEKDGVPNGTDDISRRVGILANVNYSFRDRYVAEVSVRSDGSSIYGRDAQFAPFWSAGVAWNAHKEGFLQSSETVTQMKLRGSAGITGAANFNTSDAVATYNYITTDDYNGWLGARQMSLENPALTWQKTTKFNLGVDIGFFKDRLQLVADVYREHTKGLVSKIDVSASHGFKEYSDNIGELVNRGFELRVTGQIVRNTEKRLYWSVTAAMIHNKNKIVKLSDRIKEMMAVYDSAEISSVPNRIWREGDSNTALYVVRSLGIDPSTGRELYLSSKGHETFTWNASDRVYVGDTEPKFLGNLNSSFRYGDFTFNISFSYRLGAKLYNSTLIQRVENADKHYNVDRRVFEERWMRPGDRTFFKGVNETTATRYTSRFVQDESTLRCNNINLMYDVRNSKFLKKNLGITNLSVRANVSDIFYLSTVKRERGTTYPFSRQFSLGLNLTF